MVAEGLPGPEGACRDDIVCLQRPVVSVMSLRISKPSSVIPCACLTTGPGPGEGV